MLSLIPFRYFYYPLFQLLPCDFLSVNSFLLNLDETHNTSEYPVMINISSLNKISTAFFYGSTFNSNRGEKSIESCSVSISCYWRIYRNRNNGRGLTTTRTILSILLFSPYYLRNPLKRSDITMGPRGFEPLADRL
jgi:hypothetical protein